MAIDFSIARWSRDVATRQWSRDDLSLAGIGADTPVAITESRALAEVHRLDLSLFVVFEEAALRVSGALTRRAPTALALAFAAQQTVDEARHFEMFSRRLADSTGVAASAPTRDILIPPLQRFLDLCYEVADGGSFVEGLTLMNLVLEGMAYPLYAYEERYWAPVDPYLTRLIRSAFVDETRHVAFGAATVHALLAGGDQATRARVQRITDDARRVMGEVFDYYVRKFVGLFDAVARRHAGLFKDAELAPGRRLADTPYQEQVAIIRHSIDSEHARLLARAGLSS